MKKIIIFSLLCLVLSGCASNTVVNIPQTEPSIDNTVETTEQIADFPIESENDVTTEEVTQEETTTTQEETTTAPKPTEPPTTQAPTEAPTVVEQVEIVMTMVSFDDTETIDNYVSNLNKDSDVKYYKYDDTHYAYKVDKSEQIRMANEIISEKGKKDAIAEMNSSYPGVFKDIEYKNNGGDVTIKVDRALFEEQGFAMYFYVPIVGSVYGDTLQAYNLIPINQRQYNVEIIDYLTFEKIM